MFDLVVLFLVFYIPSDVQFIDSDCRYEVSSHPYAMTFIGTTLVLNLFLEPSRRDLPLIICIAQDGESFGSKIRII